MSPPTEWTVTRWRRPIYWRPLLLAAGLNLITIVAVIISHAHGLMPRPATALILGAIVAKWHWYLRLPISGLDAHRQLPTPSTDGRTDTTTSRSPDRTLEEISQ